jgi:hypothetical protein
MNKLPGKILDALVDRMVDLMDAPWDAEVAAPGDDPAYREVTFGSGYGLASFRVDDDAELIWVYNIVWIG